MREIFSEMIVDMEVDNMLEKVVDEVAREVVYIRGRRVTSRQVLCFIQQLWDTE